MISVREEARASQPYYQRWLDSYGRLVAEQLAPDRRYSLVRVGEVEFAFTDFDAYVRALSQVWDAGLVPEPLATALGRDLPGVAPRLQGVNVDLGDLRVADVKPRRPRRFQ
jgi:hypothetical protein